MHVKDMHAFVFYIVSCNLMDNGSYACSTDQFQRESLYQTKDYERSSHSWVLHNIMYFSEFTLNIRKNVKNAHKS